MAGRSLVLGLGNDLVSDDGFGPRVAALCAERLGRRPDVAVESAAVAGFRLLDLLSGYGRALIVDVVSSGTRPPGSLSELPLSEASRGRTLGGSHQIDLETALSLGRRLGYELPASVRVLAAEARDLSTIHEGLSPELEAAVPRAVEQVLEWVEGEEVPP